MTNEEAVRIFKIMRSADSDILLELEKQALDRAIAMLEHDGNHSGDSTDMVTQFDERVDKAGAIEAKMSPEWGIGMKDAYFMLYTLQDMQKHIRKQQDILRELVELRHIKTTQGKTPEYLERQPKAWARAEEAVK